MNSEQQPNEDSADENGMNDSALQGKVTKKKERDVSKVAEPQPIPIDHVGAFRSAFDSSGIGMAFMSPAGKILEANNAICSFTGYFKHELVGRNFLDLGHPDDNHTDVLLLNKMLTNLLNYYTHEKRYISKNGRIVWGIHTVSKMLDGNGRLLYYVLQLVDVTKRKELANELNRQNTELELIRAGLANKIRQLEELNSIISHNLRGPANNIRMLIGMLKDKYRQTDNENLQLEVEEIVDYLDDGSSSLLSSLNTLNDIVQISMNKEIPFDDCDVQQLINTVLGQLSTVVPEKKARVICDLAISTISYPKVFLESILYNLISNALKYTSPERQPEITIRTYGIQDRVLLSVKDNGLGIDLVKYGKKIFKLNQVFHPGHDSRGVGLYITKAQIESFGGNIQINSTVNVGTEFIVTL